MVIDKPMRWAVEATARLGLLPKFPRDALAIQRAAAPLLAAVRAAEDLRSVGDELQFTRVDGGENKLAVAFANLERALPAALKAMESADAEARPS